MTFSVLVTKENQRRVEGTVWAADEARCAMVRRRSVAGRAKR